MVEKTVLVTRPGATLCGQSCLSTVSSTMPGLALLLILEASVPIPQGLAQLDAGFLSINSFWGDCESSPLVAPKPDSQGGISL